MLLFAKVTSFRNNSLMMTQHDPYDGTNGANGVKAGSGINATHFPK
jgi:hypothetical protein